MGDINFFVSVLFLLLFWIHLCNYCCELNYCYYCCELNDMKLEKFLFSLENNSELKQLRRRPRRQLQKNNRFNDQNDSSARVHHAFKYISLMTNFPSSFRTWIKSSRIQLQENSPAFDILSGSKQTRLCLKERKFIFYRRFHCLRRRKVPNVITNHVTLK